MDTVVVDTPDGEVEALAANTAWLRTRGLMLREPQPIALVWPETGKRSVHTFFCGSALDVVWVSGGTAMGVSTVGRRSVSEPYLADTVVEAPEGKFAGIEEGDDVDVVDV